MNPPPQKHNNDTSNTRGKEKGGVTNSTDVMDTAEKERRQKIKSLFAQLHAMLPHVPHQVPTLLTASILIPPYLPTY